MKPKFLIPLLLVSLLPGLFAAQEIVIKTFTYKKVGDLEIKLDAHRPNDAVIRPLAVWLHGGALINGGRQGTGSAGKELLKAGYCVVSVDYRLAPETKLPAIIEDVEDAFRWLRENGREKLSINPARIAVLGGSAGGYLALTAGFRVRPRPTVIVSYWGYGDLVGSSITEPSKADYHWTTKMTDEQIAAVEAGPAVANDKDRTTDGKGYYQMCRQRGLWALKVAGFDPVKEKQKFMPYMPAYNVKADYPPTFMIHGTEDRDVAYEQSQIMAREFARAGVPHQFISVPGADHGLARARPEDKDAAHAAVLPFIEKYMKL